MFKYKQVYFTLIAIICATASFGQIASQTKDLGVNAVKPTNYLEALMLIIAGLLVFVIWVLSNVLFMISKKAVEISKSGKKVLMIGWIVMGTLFANTASAQATATAASTVTGTTQVTDVYYGGLSFTTFWTLATVLALELFIIFMLVLFIKGVWKAIYPEAVVLQKEKILSQSWMIRSWNYLDKKFFTKAVPLEKEADMLLDHDYDGIKELDNALPPWWKYGFLITIFIAAIYLLKYEVWHNGPNPTEEYNAEMTTAKEQVDAYLANAKNNVDEKNITISDAAGIAAGKVSFTKTCVACHSSNGEGGVGPNLTDDYWIHGGKIADIFKTIKYGYPDKGMQSWQTTYSPIQIKELASYIKSLRGTNPPNPKAPQGDLYKETVSVQDTSANKKS
jgi:cytochrome c oxidase cbb3-type subunit 3